jgi:hypothetical protein
VKRSKEAAADMTRLFNPEEPKLLPPVQRVEDGWARAMAVEAEAVNLPIREEERKQAAANLGIQPEQLAQPEPQPETPSLLSQLTVFASSPAGPTVETAEKIAQLRKSRAEQNANLKAQLRRELASSLLRASETCATIQKLAKEYRPILSTLREVPEHVFLDQLPSSEASITLVTKLRESLDSVIDMLDSGPKQIEAQGRSLDVTVEQITTPTLSPNDRQEILNERNALENLCEMVDTSNVVVRRDMDPNDPRGNTYRTESSGQITALLRQILHYRQTIDRLIQEETSRALTAATLPQVERTVEQEKALSRAAGEDSKLLKRLRG